MTEVPFHKFVVTEWNNKAVACVCAFLHMAVMENILLSVTARTEDYPQHCLYLKTMQLICFGISLLSRKTTWTPSGRQEICSIINGCSRRSAVSGKEHLVSAFKRVAFQFNISLTTGDSPSTNVNKLLYIWLGNPLSADLWELIMVKWKVRFPHV